MLFADDFIDGDKFEELRCVDILYYDTHEVQMPNIGHPYTLITHNSDNSPPNMELPPYITKWYAQNLSHHKENVHSIPIGLERKRWHPWKMATMSSADISLPRMVRAVAQFNPGTNNTLRLPVAEICQSGRIPCDFEWTWNGFNFDSYINNLTKYYFCICPPGNGVETHRMWEALYLGCIPIVQRHIAHNAVHDLPILFIDDWSEVTTKLLEDTLDRTHYFRHNNIVPSRIQKMSFSYWKNVILSGSDPITTFY